MIDATASLRDLLKEFKLKSFVKTTGGKGLHVVEPDTSWAKAKQFTKALAQHMVSADRREAASRPPPRASSNG